nr:MAG TPA: hypothetical protein [Caudoviricetes sp.]
MIKLKTLRYYSNEYEVGMLLLNIVLNGENER